MMDISNAIKEGASSFLKRGMKIIIPVAIALSLIIGIFLTLSNGIAFAVGASLSAVAGLLMGSVVTGILLAYHLANTGGAWNDAKKLVEMQEKKVLKFTKLQL